MRLPEIGLSRFLVRLAGFATLQMVIATVIYCNGSPYDSNHYMSALQDKIARLESCPENRLIVLGGSNVAFGIHSQELQQKTGRETINLGLHMSLGLRFPMECVRKHGRRGDVVVLMPEYQLLTSHIQDGDPVTIHQLLEQWPQATCYFDQSRYASWKQFLDHDALWKGHQWVKRAWYGMSGRDLRDDIYQRASFNQYGDVVAHYGQGSGVIKQNEPLPPIDPQRLDQAIEMLNAFARECRQRGMDVYFSYPPIPENRFASSTRVVNQVHEELQSNLKIPLLDRPEEFVFPLDHFFDTSYHLSEKGGEKRTRAVADALAARLQIAAAAPDTLTR